METLNSLSKTTEHGGPVKKVTLLSTWPSRGMETKDAKFYLKIGISQNLLQTIDEQTLPSFSCSFQKKESTV